MKTCHVSVGRRIARVLLVGVFALGCTDSHPGPGGGPGDAAVPADAGKDAGATDGGAADGGAPKPVPTKITLRNAGSAPLVVGDQCGGGFLGLSHEGMPLPYDRSCACACDSGSGCGCPAICLITEALLVPGQESTVDWDGRWLRYDKPECYELAGLAEGDAVTAEACFRVGTFDGAPICESETFAYDTDRDVTIEAVPHSAARAEATIVLDNQTGGPIEIVTDRCGAQHWFDLALPGDRASLSAFCPCACTADFTPDNCPVCGACAPDVVETVANDASQSFTWDGQFWHSYESGCAARYAMPSGFMVSAEVCFTKAGATSETCQPFSFMHGQSDEVHVVVN